MQSFPKPLKRIPMPHSQTNPVMISIITVTYNSAATLADTLHSIRQQTYPFIEHIIIDGASTDATLAIIEEHRYRFPNVKVVSEPDEGIYDAMNKGIELATGDYVAFLNSDDLYNHSQVIERIAFAALRHRPDTLYGDLWYVKRDDTNYVYRYWKSGHFIRRNILFGWMAPHPTFFVKRSLLQRYGGFDASFGLSADYEMMVRLLYKNRLSTHYIPEILVRMRLGGAGNVALKSRVKANREDRRAWRKNGYSSLFLYVTTWLKPIRKIIQFLPYFKKRLLPADSTDPPVSSPEVRRKLSESSVE